MTIDFRVGTNFLLQMFSCGGIPRLYRVLYTPLNTFISIIKGRFRVSVCGRAHERRQTFCDGDGKSILTPLLPPPRLYNCKCDCLRDLAGLIFSKYERHRGYDKNTTANNSRRSVARIFG